MTKQVRREVHRSVAQLEAAIRTYIDAHNAEPKPFIGPRPPTRFAKSRRGQ